MAPRVLVACLLVMSLAGCAGLSGDGGPESTAEIVVQNEGSTALEVDVRVTGPDGDVVASATDTVQPNVARTFEFTVSGDGRYEATVEGPDVAGSVSWTAGMCARFRGEVIVSDDGLDSRGECLEAR